MGDLESLLIELTKLREQCDRLAASGNTLVRQMAAADARSFDQAIRSIWHDADPQSVLGTLETLRPIGSQVRAKVAELAETWKRNNFFTSEDSDDEEEDLLQRVVRDGMLVTYEDWDSGGPGAGAGRVCVYLYEGSYYSTHDAGLSGPFASEGEACRSVGISEE